MPGPQHPWVLRGITLPKPCTPPCPQGQTVRPGHPRIAHGKLCISSITGWFGDAWGERMGMGQDEAPSPACSGSPQTSGSPPRRLLWGALFLTHSSRIPSPHRPPDPGAPAPGTAGDVAGRAVAAVAAPAVARCPAPPASPGTRDRAAAAGACSRNGHGWAGTAAPRLRARGQQQLVRGLSLTSPRAAAPAQSPRRRDPPQLITRVAPWPRRAGVRPGRPNPPPRQDPAPPWASASCRWHPPGGGGRGSRPSPPSGSATRGAGREGGRPAASRRGPRGSVCYKCILELFIKVAKNLC